MSTGLKKESKFGGKVFLSPELIVLYDVTPKNIVYNPLNPKGL